MRPSGSSRLHADSVYPSLFLIVLFTKFSIFCLDHGASSHPIKAVWETLFRVLHHGTESFLLCFICKSFLFSYRGEMVPSILAA